MKISNAIKLYLEYHKSHSKENSIRAYMLVLAKLNEEFGDENLEYIKTEKTIYFLNRITEGKKQQTKKTRFSHLPAFFNFIKKNLDQDFKNPCDTPILKKLFRAKPTLHLCYETAREMAAKAGSVVSIHLRPHDLRRQQLLMQVARECP